MYLVYVNRPNRYATVHRTSCSQPKKGGGVSRRTPPTGWYLEDFATAAAARAAAAATGHDVIACRYCAP